MDIKNIKKSIHNYIRTIQSRDTAGYPFLMLKNYGVFLFLVFSA